MFSLFKPNKRSATESVDIIESIVYAYLKPLGFKKHGRTLHRFVDTDISQVVNFQTGCPAKGVHDILWVNLGIRVPECDLRKFEISEPLKNYYYEYECNLRARLGSIVDGKDTFYDLKKDPNKIAKNVVSRIEKYVMPIFDTLNSRDAILRHRTEYAHFDETNHHLILLEEAMILGRRGDIAEAERLFNAYYQKVLAKYQHALAHGTETYLRKGERLVYRNTKTGETETITAAKSGYVTAFNANNGHVTYLEALAKDLGIALCSSD